MLFTKTCSFPSKTAIFANKSVPILQTPSDKSSEIAIFPNKTVSIPPTLSAKSSKNAIFANKMTPIPPTLSAQLMNPPQHLALLPWSHYERLMRVDNPTAREWYMREAAEQSWSYRTLDRNINTQYYERLLSSQMKAPVADEMRKKTKAFQDDKLAFIKNPAVLEFLGLPGNAGHTEAELEQAILSNLQQFLIELGRGFAFVARQKLIRTEAEDYLSNQIQTFPPHRRRTPRRNRTTEGSLTLAIRKGKR